MQKISTIQTSGEPFQRAAHDWVGSGRSFRSYCVLDEAVEIMLEQKPELRDLMIGPRLRRAAQLRWGSHLPGDEWAP